MNDITTVDRSFALTPAGVKEHVNMIATLMRDVLVKGEHYGPIPGVKTKEGEKERQVLHKSGAEKLGLMFGFVPTFTVETVEMPNDHRDYRITCRLATRNGQLVAEGVGSCCTKEKKYRWRQGERLCPQCGKPAIRKSREGGGWYCWSKLDGCGQQYLAGDASIENQDVNRSENPDIADVYNTCLKMGKKRAHVDAMITACAASDIFTQDVDENLEQEQEARRAEQAKPVQQEAAQNPKASTVAAAQGPTGPAKSSSNAPSGATSTKPATAATATPGRAAPTAPTTTTATAAEIQAKTIQVYQELQKYDAVLAAGIWLAFNSFPERHQRLVKVLLAVQQGITLFGEDSFYESLNFHMDNAQWPTKATAKKDAKGNYLPEGMPTAAVVDSFVHQLSLPLQGAK